MEFFSNWKDYTFNGELREEGEFFVNFDDLEMLGLSLDETIINYNDLPSNQPSLWCQWIINDKNELVWNGMEKFYEYDKWLEYILNNFLKEYNQSGIIIWQGEDETDKGKLIVVNGKLLIERE